MSNRFLGVLIIIGFIGAGYLYYNLKYIPSKQEKVQKQLIENKERAEKELEEREKPKLIKREIKQLELSNNEKIEEIKEKNNNYKVFKLENSYKAYFKQSSEGLDLYFNEDKIGSFELVKASTLRVEIVKGTRKDLYIEAGDNKYYYNNTTKIISKIDLNIDVKYIKNGLDKSLVIVTSKGAFVYSVYNKDLEYFTYFNDFVHFSDGYLGLVSKKDKRIINNLGFDVNYNDLIVYYNPDTKEKRIVYQTEFNLGQIYFNSNKLYLSTITGDLYKLENIK